MSPLGTWGEDQEAHSSGVFFLGGETFFAMVMLQKPDLLLSISMLFSFLHADISLHLHERDNTTYT